VAVEFRHEWAVGDEGDDTVGFIGNEFQGADPEEYYYDAVADGHFSCGFEVCYGMYEGVVHCTAVWVQSYRRRRLESMDKKGIDMDKIWNRGIGTERSGMLF
jgi:hypothetical protein